jgi:hypothetical protein
MQSLSLSTSTTCAFVGWTSPDWRRPEDSSSAWNGPKTLQIPLNPQTLTPKSWSKNIGDGGYCAPVLPKLGTKGEVGMEKYAGKTTRGQTSFPKLGTKW